MKYDNLINNIIEKKKISFIGDNIALNNEQINILNRYNIPYESCHSYQELILFIEELLDSGIDDEELENVSTSLAECDYYKNYKK